MHHTFDEQQLTFKTLDLKNEAVGKIKCLLDKFPNLSAGILVTALAIILFLGLGSWLLAATGMLSGFAFFAASKIVEAETTLYEGKLPSRPAVTIGAVMEFMAVLFPAFLVGGLIAIPVTTDPQEGVERWLLLSNGLAAVAALFLTWRLLLKTQLAFKNGCIDGLNKHKDKTPSFKVKKYDYDREHENPPEPSRYGYLIVGSVLGLVVLYVFLLVLPGL